MYLIFGSIFYYLIKIDNAKYNDNNNKELFNDQNLMYIF